MKNYFLAILFILSLSNFALANQSSGYGAACGAMSVKKTVCVGEHYCRVSGEISGPLSTAGSFLCGSNLVIISNINQARRTAGAYAFQELSCPDFCQVSTGYSKLYCTNSCCTVTSTIVCGY
jgi:hypothetical protein